MSGTAGEKLHLDESEGEREVKGDGGGGGGVRPESPRPDVLTLHILALPP